MSIKYTNNFKFQLPRIIPIYENVSDGETLGQIMKNDDKDDIKYDIMTIDSHELLHMKHIGLLINEHDIKDNICDEYKCQYSIFESIVTVDLNVEQILVIHYTIKNKKIYFGISSNNNGPFGHMMIVIDESHKDIESRNKFVYDNIYQNYAGRAINNMYRYLYKYGLTTAYCIFCLIDSDRFFYYYPHDTVREILKSNTEIYKFKSMTVDDLSRESNERFIHHTNIYASVIEYNENEHLKIF
jgi:hypothetical protein